MADVVVADVVVADVVVDGAVVVVAPIPPGRAAATRTTPVIQGCGVQW
jgi:hypothetical protein